MTDTVWMSDDKTMFEVTQRNGKIGFDVDARGFYVRIDGYQVESIQMNNEEFEAFKAWIRGME